jgi:hypothetical protein
MATAFSDNFNRANGALSASANWDGIIPGTEGIQISSNTVYLRGSGAYVCHDRVATGAYTFSGDQGASATFTTVGSNTSGIGARLTTGTGTNMSGYGVEVKTTQVELFSYVNWNYSHLAAGPSRNTIGSWVNAISANDVITIKCIGTTISVEVNGTERISVTDSDHSSGQPGLYTNTNAGSWNYVDDFEGLELAPADGGGSPLSIGLEGVWNRNMGHP